MAIIYGGGRAEEILGHTLREVSGMRDRILITSKCGVRHAGSPHSDSPQRWDFSPHDVFVVPSWEFHELHAATDCVLFSYTDRAAQEALGFWREEVV